MAKAAAFTGMILLIGACWIGAWKWGAQALEESVANSRQRLVAMGGKLGCDKQRIEGFPFRLGVFCNNVSFASPNGLAFSASGFRSAAQLYKPGHFIAELDSPAAIQLPNGVQFELGWGLLHSSAKANFSGLENIDLEIEQPVVSEGGGTAGSQTLASGEFVELHARLSPEMPDALDLAITARSIRDEKDRFPSFSLTGDFMLQRMAGVLAGDMVSGPGLLALARQFGIAGTIRSVVLKPVPGGSLELSGPLEVDSEGLLSGEIMISAQELPGLVAFLVQVLPDQREIVNNIGALLAGLEPDQATQGEMAGQRSIVLNIKRGKLSLGFIELAQIPPLF